MIVRQLMCDRCGYAISWPESDDDHPPPDSGFSDAVIGTSEHDLCGTCTSVGAELLEAFLSNQQLTVEHDSDIAGVGETLIVYPTAWTTP